MKTDQAEIDPVAEINSIDQIKEKGTIQADTDLVVTEDLDLETVNIIETIAEIVTEAQVEKDGVKVKIQDQDLDQDLEMT